jgi:transposase
MASRMLDRAYAIDGWCVWTARRARLRGRSVTSAQRLDRFGRMPISYLPYEPQQQRLLPDALQDWLPEGHLAYFISDSVDSLDLSAFHGRYAKGGPRNQPFHPAMMVKVLIYGYATGTFSSRKLAAKLHEDIALRVLAAENYPAHRTLSDFRALHLEELAALFVQVVRLARECGLVKLGTVAVDGTKLKANASGHKAMSYDRMVKAEGELKAQIDGLLNRARAADDLEKNEPDLDIPGEIKRREDRLKAITEAKLRLEQRQREADAARGRSADDERKPRDKSGKPKGGRYKRDFGVPKDSAQESFTDTDSRIMKRSGGGYDYGYNAHTAVDESAQLVVAAELSTTAISRWWRNWPGCAPSDPRAPGCWSRRCLAGGASPTGANWPAAWGWHLRHMRAATARSSKASARPASSERVRCWSNSPGAGCACSPAAR